MDKKMVKTTRTDQLWAVLFVVNHVNLDDAVKQALIDVAYTLSFKERCARSSKPQH